MKDFRAILDGFKTNKPRNAGTIDEESDEEY